MAGDCVGLAQLSRLLLVVIALSGRAYSVSP
ncbi:hypothetical protein LVISKB_0112 [Levilactobacillus brevis KB290]|uniref:Uncharacterized protein n=1 Tax=Levilactobacillus brevis KB290 TaxID=1001583 RepID=M5ABT2_LEVBR|nr:hypothetical protein LVISKB_0112 [Levilactobacillus brevis KB290]